MASQAAASADETVTTYGHQDDLQSLPVPDLEDTLKKYLVTVKPFLTPEEMEHTEAVVEDFKNGIGAKLQEMLVARGEEERNWLEDWWENLAYLSYQIPTAVNINYHGVLPGSYWGRLSSPEVATFFTEGITIHHLQLQAGTFEPEKMGPATLCMNQYVRMFHSCRLPGDTQDSIELYERSRHIVVLRSNAIYSFDVLDENFELLPTEVIHLQYARIIDDADMMFDAVGSPEPPVSVLTGDDRKSWAAAREHLVEISEENEKNLEVIQTALFAVSLDSRHPKNYEEVARACLCGDGRNKWYDKPFNLVVFDNGRAGLNGEHAWADAIVNVRLFQRTLRVVENKFRDFARRVNEGAKMKGQGMDGAREVRRRMLDVASGVKGRVPEPRKLTFKVDTGVRQAIERASITVGRLIDKSDLRLLVFRHYGQDFIKRYKLIPDFYVQMAIQLAYRRLFNPSGTECIPGINYNGGKTVATYETAHTRMFYHGRTETVRTCSQESIAFVDAMQAPLDIVPLNKKFDALKAAIAAHKLQLVDCLQGMGIDRHLLGLRILAEFSGVKPKPSIFSDAAYLRSTNFILSSSNVDGFLGGFSPFDDRGIGVCYGINKGYINFSIVASKLGPKPPPPTTGGGGGDSTATRFRAELENALMDMQEVLFSRNVMYVASSKM